MDLLDPIFQYSFQDEMSLCNAMFYHLFILKNLY
jgi:hypothetical protein